MIGARHRLSAAAAVAFVGLCLIGAGDADKQRVDGKRGVAKATAAKVNAKAKRALRTPASAPARAAVAGTLDRLVRAFDRRIGRSLKGRDLPRTDLVLVTRAERGTPRALRDVVQRLVVARLAQRKLRSHAVWSDTLDAARLRSRARMSGAELALDMTLALNNGYLHLRGELYATDSSLWRDTVRPRRGSLAHLHASLRADAEVRAYQGTRSRKRLSFARREVELAWRTVLALAIADLDGDGRRELFILEPRRVELWRFVGNAYKRVSFLALPAPLASIRPRRDMGTLLVTDVDGDGKRELLVRSSVHEQCVEITLRGDKLEKRRTLPGYALMALEVAGKRARLMATPAAGVDWFQSTSLALDGPQAAGATNGAASAGAAAGAATGAAKAATSGPTQAAVAAATKLLPAAFYALQATQIASAKGPRRFAAALDTSGRLYVYDGKLKRAIGSSAGIGIGFSLGDIDDDGQLDVLSSDPTGPEADDRVSVHRVKGGQLTQLWRSAELGGRVLAIAHGDLDGNGKQEIVVAIAPKRGRLKLVIFG